MAEEAELDEKPQPRVHRADVEGDVKSLDRLGERNLYLIVKQDSVWTFPTGPAETKQVPLHKIRFHLVKGAWELASIFRPTLD